MGLRLFLGDYEHDPPNEENDPHGHKAFAFEMLRELSDVAETQVSGMNGDTTVKLRIPQAEAVRIQREIAENVPPSRMKGLFDAIEAHSAQARGALEQMNGHAGSVDKRVIGLTLRLNATLRKLLESAAIGEAPVIHNDVFDDELHDAALPDVVAEGEGDDEWDNWDEKHPEDGIVAEEGNDNIDDHGESCQPWKVEADFWKPEDEREVEDDDDDDEGHRELHLSTPEPIDVDPETETLILSEAAEMVIDMRIIINDFREMLDYIKNAPKDQRPVGESVDYHETIIEVMQHISDRSDGKTNLECLAIELESDEVARIIARLNDIEQLGVVPTVFHNVAEAALMLVDAFSDIVDAYGDGDAEGNEQIHLLTLTYIERLKERFGVEG